MDVLADEKEKAAENINKEHFSGKYFDAKDTPSAKLVEKIKKEISELQVKKYILENRALSENDMLDKIDDEIKAVRQARGLGGILARNNQNFGGFESHGGVLIDKEKFLGLVGNYVQNLGVEDFLSGKIGDYDPLPPPATTPFKHIRF